ncbi:hypothetical protein BDW74DRAFT_65853 [Aspergillus multicolor]|uniref:uncharacterized protein n=1 Tax=Aspergillus multicolor TaxID=41759 RepID=UPI003CCD5577
MAFSHRKSLDRHKSTIHANGDPKKVCPHDRCKRTFTRQDNLAEHRRRCHGDFNPSARAATCPSLDSGSSSSSPSRGIVNILSSPARHTTGAECDRVDCPRQGKPFRTVSDLRRHQRSVHRSPTGTDSDKGYICASKDCPRPDKKWPRLDNLRSHIYKMHGEEDTEDLITRSAASKFDLFGRGQHGALPPEHDFVPSKYLAHPCSKGA